jgi:hypothetical protein
MTRRQSVKSSNKPGLIFLYVDLIIPLLYECKNVD